MNIEGKAVYLSGPITGAAGYGRAFERARMALRCAGALWVYDPSSEVPRDTPWRRAMLLDLGELACADPDAPALPYYDCLLALPGWRESSGCRLEVAVARALGIPCWELLEYDKVGCITAAAILDEVEAEVRHGAE